MMAKPIILITAGRQNNYTPRREVQTVTYGCDVDYLDAVRRSGGVPLMLPANLEPEDAVEALRAADGLLLSGGGDVCSLLYGEEPHQKSKYQDMRRDAAELALARVAMAQELPTLGICRGLQLLNVALGGTLIQDVPSQVPESVKHWSDGLDVLLQHTIRIEDGSLFARVMGTTEMAVNSWHHQAVNALGEGLRISARARDGIVEGIESSEGKPVLAFQCHPEECAGTYPEFQRVFDWLVSEAAAYRVKGRLLEQR
jgi:putative glutamine amidotransferase